MLAATSSCEPALLILQSPDTDCTDIQGPRTTVTISPLRAAHADGELVFTAERGGRLIPSNLMSRVLKPAAVKVGLGEWIIERGRRRAETWVGFHSFRHTCATQLFLRG